MKETPPGYETVQAWLSATRDEELDCDRFNALIAPWLDQRITDQKLLALLEHHRHLCAECAEEVSLVEAALGGDDPKAPRGG